MPPKRKNKFIDDEAPVDMEAEESAEESDAEVPPPPKKKRTVAPLDVVRKIDLPKEEEEEFKDGDFYAYGKPCQLSEVEAKELKIPKMDVEGLKYGSFYSVFMGFPLETYPGDNKGLCLGYSTKRGMNFFFTPDKKFRGPLKEDDVFPSEMAELKGQSRFFTPHFFWLRDIYILRALAVEIKGPDKVVPIGSRGPFPSASSIALPRCWFSKNGGKPIINYPLSEQEKVKKLHPYDPNVSMGLTPERITINPRMETYFNNGANRRPVCDLPTHKVKLYHLIQPLIEGLASSTVEATRDAINNGFKPQGKEHIARYQYGSLAPGKTLNETLGELLDLHGNGSKLNLDVNTYFSTWVKEGHHFHRGRKNPNKPSIEGLPVEDTYALQAGGSGRKTT